MIPIVLDLSDTINEFSLSKEDANGLISYVVKEVTARFARQWANEAKGGLTGTREKFLNSIVVGEEGPLKGYVMLVGSLPNMIEGGAQAYDMKPGFDKSNKAKVGKDGNRYLTIPFRFGTPSALGESSIFSATLPDEVYQEAKKLPPMITGVGGKISSGGTLDLKNIPSKFQIPEVRSKVQTKSKIFEEYTHKTSIYAGLKKSQSVTGKGSQYVSFRRVSMVNSDPNSWIHKGMVARDFAGKAFQNMNVPFEVDKSTDIYLAKLGF